MFRGASKKQVSTKYRDIDPEIKGGNVLFLNQVYFIRRISVLLWSNRSCREMGETYVRT